MGEEMIPSFKIDWSPDMRETALNNLEDVLSSGMIAAGKYVNRCEEWIKERTGIGYALMMSSGSAALEACAYALREKHGLGKVLIPANTFIATALAFERMGFEIDFYRNGILNVNFEIPDGYVGIVVVDLGGTIPEDIYDLIEEAHERGMWVCEDAAQAFGSSLNGVQAGWFSDIAIYSFFATKVFTSGEGGAVVTDNEDLAERVWMYRDFGKEERWVSWHTAKGWNCRMNELGAAVLYAQLIYFDNILKARAGIRNKYREELSSVAGIFFPPVPFVPHLFNGYKTMMFLDPMIDKDRFIERCKELGVKFQGSVYEWVLPDEQPIYHHKLPVAGEWAYDWKRMVCLPSWYGMKYYHIHRVIDAIKQAAEEEMNEEDIIKDRLRGLGYSS